MPPQSYHQHLPFSSARANQGLSERQLALDAGLSRSCVRSALAAQDSCSIGSIVKVCKALGLELTLVGAPAEIFAEYSTIAVGIQIQAAGFDSWKLHLFNLVDEFRRTSDPRLILLPPPHQLEERLRALLASTVLALCRETSMSPPAWAQQRIFLQQPWFVAEIESLKATALVESPYEFRRNNIFVFDNFLTRA